MKKNLDAALEYVERGMSVIPIRPDTKRPRIKWREYQERIPTEEEVMLWWEEYPDDDIALVTGVISGLVVVDCDNEDALNSATSEGMSSPCQVKTKRGTHFYFRHPNDGVRRGPRAGIHSRGEDWPRIDGLDFRGDGGYALLPPSKGYEWRLAIDLDEAPVWKDWRPKVEKPAKTMSFDFSDLDLSPVRPIEEYVSEWDRTAKFVREKFPHSLKIPTGMSNGRNERVMRWISECILDGMFGDELRVRGHAFMREFFEDELSPSEFEATCRSMEEAERRNHPERFDEDGRYIFSTIMPTSPSEPVASEAPTDRPRLIQMSDAEELLERAGAQTFFIEPWLPAQTIVQVHGFSGHGKSIFIQNAVAALAAGKRYFGPFEIMEPARVLYVDFENGMSTLAKRLIDMRQYHGDTGDRLNIWTPFVEGQDMNLKTKAGLVSLQRWIEECDPQVVVLDTVRSGWSGLQENDASEWAAINTLCLRLRNSGHAVIVVHHSNKPSEGGLGREAGSTNQLTVLETQIKITQVYNDKDTASAQAAIYDGDYDHPVWPALQSKLDGDFRLMMVMEVRYGKVREWTDTHDRVQWVGFAQCAKTGKKRIVSSSSTKQRAKAMALDGVGPEVIATRLGRPFSTIRDWLGLSVGE